ncbi:hypothetical protein GUITHDRAFT_97434 [Guillardia theta CCMP2712]|uniref:N-acetyltransferase domain-containing protein n=1 Tax=Guillardia theta (strain CCMP2712) TaxID=905079 RepID=L1ILA1_GUITC|nr:hypothetical protein GUITHDRAFT_97434 [Guillardia theta CCMP2712]EKX36892.1 hypothetical protein GUITHDRAFT_97434 [Guillardia theta CCMP2712]|eukprot:XP_005823872.1 hypothetical protein GUITHDRAFT_97434 [Guillardia theta CCMP2712]
MQFDELAEDYDAIINPMQPVEQRYKKKLPVCFGPITDKNVEQVKTLNRSIFPVKYNDKFYNDVQNSGNYTQLAYYSTDILVGAICCRVEKKEDASRLYIMTIGVLAPYRCCGVGTSLLEMCLNLAAEDADIDEAYLHVQTSNTDAINFYKRFGFEVKDKILNYYKRIDPPDCFVLSKQFTRRSQ